MSHFQEKLTQLYSLVKFLHTTKEFENVREICAAVRDQTHAHFQEHERNHIYNFTINVDLGKLLEHNADLGNKVLLSLTESTSLFQEILFEHCQANDLLLSDTTLSQISTRLRVNNFPAGLLSLQIHGISELTQFTDYPGLVQLVGIVTGMSGVAKYTRSTKYMCSDEDCEGSQGNKYIRTHVPGASETQTIRSDFKCRFCGETLEEIKASRTLSDKVIAEIVPIKPGHRESFNNGRLQAVPVFVRDDLVEKVKLGKTFEVIGITRTDYNGDSISNTLEANNIIELEKPKIFTTELIPDSIRDAYCGTCSSPWRFPFYMAYRFGEQILSRGSMLKLKLVLLTSLVLDPQKHSLHVMCLCRETSQVHRLMEFSKQFSPRVFNNNAATPLSAYVRKDGTNWSPHFVQAGSLSLSTGGLCLLGDVSIWSKQNRDQLQSIVSSHKQFVELPTKGAGGLPQQEVLPLQCQVWAVYDPSSNPHKSTKTDLLLPAAETGQIGKPLLDSFSYLAFLDSGDSATDEEMIHHTAVHTLVSWAELGQERDADILKHHDLDKYLKIARNLVTEMTVEAESLIYSYYMASRSTRTSGLSGSDVPTSALNALTSLAVGIAKLSLSTVVSEEAAILAIYLYEENLTSRFGLSVLNIQPQPHISESQISQWLGKELDVHMKQFQLGLSRFCSQVVQSRFKTEQ